MAPSQASGEDFPKLVYGYVWDNHWNLMIGVDVVVNMVAPDDSIRATLTDTTDSQGKYLVTFDTSCWAIGDRVQIIADYMGDQQDNMTLPLTDTNPQWLNVSFDFEIPEFGGMTGLLVTGGLLGAVAVVALVYFRKR